MAKFVIQPHGRLQEAVADENGYFTEEGLDYAIEGGEYFGVGTAPETTRNTRGELISGAYESYVHGGGNKGRRSDISCACHWAVNQASANSIGRMWGGAYIVSPAAIMAHPDSSIRRPEDLAGQDIAVGYAMKRAQMEIDLRPEKHKHLYAPLIPERYRDELDVRLFSAGERIRRHGRSASASRARVPQPPPHP